MPKPIQKSEQDLREHEILDAVRSNINLVIASYRRRMLNVGTELIEEFRQACEDGVMPAIDAGYHDHIKVAVQGQAKALR